MTQRFSEVPHGVGSLRPGTVTHRPVSLALEAYRTSSASREGIVQSCLPSRASILGTKDTSLCGR